MSKPSVVSIRHRAFVNQMGCCFYCNTPMWEGNPQRFISVYKVTLKQAKLLQCTAEHLTPKSTGGTNNPSNIVAACQFCNRTRHKAKHPLAPERYLDKVKLRVSKGGWLPSKLVDLRSLVLVA